MGLILKIHLYPIAKGEASAFFFFFSEDLPVILAQQLISSPPSFTGKFLESSAYISGFPSLCRLPHAMLQLHGFLLCGCLGSWLNSRLCTRPVIKACGQLASLALLTRVLLPCQSSWSLCSSAFGYLCTVLRILLPLLLLWTLSQKPFLLCSM